MWLVSRKTVQYGASSLPKFPLATKMFRYSSRYSNSYTFQIRYKYGHTIQKYTMHSFAALRCSSFLLLLAAGRVPVFRLLLCHSSMPLRGQGMRFCLGSLSVLLLGLLCCFRDD
jgi:hypothetical protein